MAELPDLTVFADTLSRKFKGKILKTLDIQVAKKLNVNSKILKGRLEGQKLESVERVGKTLQLHFGKQEVLGLHLMLRGELKEIIKNGPDLKHGILTFIFDNHTGFSVTDQLKQATPTSNPEKNNTPDALAISEGEFLSLLSKKRKKIKELLMDQKLIRGVGNSYADEILWEAKISPLSIAREIPENAVKKLFNAIAGVLTAAIAAIKKENGDELRGELRDFMKIHGSKLKQSPTGHSIKSAKINGRTAYFTEEQKLYK